MKLMLRPEWRLWPLSSFLGLLDLKTGVTVALIFALLNKVAGVYGLIAVLTGAGGSFAQLSLYIYSVFALVALVWGLKAIKQEDPKQTLYFAHLFFGDHVLSTAWTIFFAVVWWVYTPHDGRRQANSDAQEEMMKGPSSGGSHDMSTEERAAAAMMIWNKEKGTAAAVITLSWMTKIYFAALLYSYATHLRKGSYRSLPHSRPNASLPAAGSSGAYDALPDEDEEIEDFYRVPARRTNGGGSLSSFADFVSAPGRPARRNGGPGKSTLSKSAHINGNGIKEGVVDGEEVLFDEGEAGYNDDSGSAQTQDEDHSPLGSQGRNRSRSQAP